MKQAILELFSKSTGQYLSGEEISKKLSVSRTAIWKHIQQLKEEGYLFESSPRLGYRLLERPDTLSVKEIKVGLKTKRIGQKAYIFDEVTSTNDQVKKYAERGEQEGILVVSEKQIAGKGRMGRTWYAPEGTGLWFSLLLRPQIPPSSAAQLVFVAAVAVCQAIRNATNLPATIKWPNDILIEDKKICGILAEMNAELDWLHYVVIGIGINVNQLKEDFPPEIAERATSLALISGYFHKRVSLLQEILVQFEKEYDHYLEKGFVNVIARWKTLNNTLGQEINVLSRDEVFSGIAEDIDQQGRLLVRTDSGELRSVLVGDVSIRKV